MSCSNSKDFFISYNSKDTDKATWIAKTLEDAGYSLIIQEWDFLPGSNFVIEMDKALRICNRVLAIVSNNYLNSNYTPSEWAEAFRLDPKGDNRKLIPVYIEDNLYIKGLLGPIIGINLSKLLDDGSPEKLNEAKEKLINGITAPKRDSRLNVHKKNDKETTKLQICINKDGNFVFTPVSLIAMTKWIANACPPDVSISIQDDRIQKYEKECAEAEEAIAKSDCVTDQAEICLFYALRELKNIKFYNKRFLNALAFFIKLNYKYWYIEIKKTADFISFIETLKYYIEAGKGKRMNDDDYVIVDFTLMEGKYKNEYYFVVPIKKSSVLKAGLSDNIGFADICLLNYHSFDKETIREIVAVFCQDIDWMTSEVGKNMLEDEEVQNLFCYELGLH